MGIDNILHVILPMFQMSSMVSSLYNYATHCDNLPVLENDISDLVGMAVNMGVEDWHYPLIAEAITDAIR